MVRALTESPGRGFEAASPQILRGKGLHRFFPSPDTTHVGASGTGSALSTILASVERTTDPLGTVNARDLIMENSRQVTFPVVSMTLISTYLQISLHKKIRTTELP